MSKNYANPIPHDESNTPLQGFPAPVIALASTTIVTNISSVVTFNDNATDIEVAALNAAAAIKWIGIGAAQTSVIASTIGANNFDHIIPSGTMRKFVIPRETQGIVGPVPANSIHGLYQRMAVVTTTNTAVGSVLVTQY